MEIFAKIENLNYKATLFPNLKEFNISKFLSGELGDKSSFILNYKNNLYGISQWKSPKRSRTYPYARVYDTMGMQTRITLIPFVKDEGFDGDRDFIQWDTVSLMSLLNVYVIIGYYENATLNQNFKNKITNQVMNYQYLTEQIDQLVNYKSSALHWNLNQLHKCHAIAQTCKENYQFISETLGVRLHSFEGIDQRIAILKEGLTEFKEHSRKLSMEAQNREVQTVQPKENTIEEKAKLTVRNFLGGEYHFTIDELIIKKDKLIFIEKKHTKDAFFPSIYDIKDGLVKMMLFSNLVDNKIGSYSFNHLSVLGLTSAKFKGFCHNKMDEQQIKECLSKNTFSVTQQKTILHVFHEGNLNKFLVFLMDSNFPEYQNEILSL
jgi:hypothetical protein